MKPQSVLVTGAGSGIGAATAHAFASRGYNVILVGRRRERLTKVAASLKSQNWIMPCDISSKTEVESLVEKIKNDVPNLFAIVNNAGIFQRKSFEESSDELWQQMYETHLLGPVRLCRGLSPILQAQKKGVIINVASTAGLRPVAGMIAYSTMKAAVIHFSQSLALELAPFQIRVHAVCPGIVETEIFDFQKSSEDTRQKTFREWDKLHPLGRMGRPEDVAWAITELASDHAQWMTGVALPVDGGISLI